MLEDRAIQEEGAARDALRRIQVRRIGQWRLNHERHDGRVIHAAGHESGDQAFVLRLIRIVVQVLVKLRRNGGDACEAEAQLHQRQQGEAGEDVSAKLRKHATPVPA